MIIAIFDCRRADGCHRSEDLKCNLEEANHSVTLHIHVHGQEGVHQALGYPYAHWPADLKANVEALVQDAEVVILHVGEGQKGVEQALSHVYRNKYVICFSGVALKDWCTKDCAQNQKHCFVNDYIPLGHEWPDLWRERIVTCLQELPTNPDVAKVKLQGFNRELENDLQVLYEMLEKGHSFEQLKQERDKRFGSESC